MRLPPSSVKSNLQNQLATIESLGILVGRGAFDPAQPKNCLKSIRRQPCFIVLCLKHVANVFYLAPTNLRESGSGNGHLIAFAGQISSHNVATSRAASVSQR